MASQVIDLLTPPPSPPAPVVEERREAEPLKKNSANDEAKRKRRYLLVQNNYDVDPFDGRPTLYARVRAEPRIVAFIGGEEVGEQGTPHVQAYFELKNPMTMVQLQEWPCFKGQGVALLSADGTAAQNIKYCSKQDEFPEKFGIFSVSREGQGRRTDWDQVHELLSEGTDTLSMAAAVPHLVYPNINRIPAWRDVHGSSLQRSWQPIIHVYFGSTGCGKSYQAAREAERLCRENDGWRVYHKADSDKWWPGYSGQEVVIIDEMDGAYFRFRILLKFLDSSPFQVQIKGGDVHMLARHVFFTCNDHPCDWYANPWLQSPLRRRIRDFGELLVFSSPIDVDGAPRQFLPPVRDLELRAYVPPLEDRAPAQQARIIAELDRDRHRF